MLLVLTLALLLPLTVLILLPFGFALSGVGHLFSLPARMVRIAFDKRRRRNNALEHATVNVLEQRYGARLSLGGFAERDGFLIQGLASPDAVLAAAKEGLKRLQAGETQLALHPRCGTTVVSGQLISLLTFFAMLLAMQSLAFGNLLLALLVALLAARTLAQPLGLLLQRTLTTSTDVQELRIDHLDAQVPSHPFALILMGGQPVQFRVWTNQLSVENGSQPKRYKAY